MVRAYHRASIRLQLRLVSCIPLLNEAAVAAGGDPIR